MSPEQFCYWLQGYVELTSHSALSERQFNIVKDHLALVFNKVTPEVDLRDVIKHDVVLDPTFNRSGQKYC